MDRFMDRIQSTEYTGTRSSLHHFIRATKISVGLLASPKFPFHNVFSGPPCKWKNPGAPEIDLVISPAWCDSVAVATPSTPATDGAGASASSPVPGRAVELVFNEAKLTAAFELFKSMGVKM